MTNNKNPWIEMVLGLRGLPEKLVKPSILPPEWLTRFSQFLRKASKWADETLPAFAYFLVVSSITLHRGGWSEAPIGHLPLEEWPALVERLSKMSDKECKEELDKFILEQYRENDCARLSEMVDGLRIHFGEQFQMLKDAMWAHKNGKYTLSMPALAAQIEGIIRDLDKNSEDELHWRKRFNDAFGYDPSYPPTTHSPKELLEGFSEMTWPEQFAFVEDLKVRLNLSRINEMFNTVSFTDPASAHLTNRHTILHGVFRNFSELESLRLFFILDALHEMIAKYKEQPKREIPEGPPCHNPQHDNQCSFIARQ